MNYFIALFTIRFTQNSWFGANCTAERRHIGPYGKWEKVHKPAMQAFYRREQTDFFWSVKNSKANFNAKA